jgi:hypothetical protein
MACSARDVPSLHDDGTFEVAQPIVGGSLDTTHEAVVALYSTEAFCTGTIVAKNGSNAFVLTAAHCVEPTAPSDPDVAMVGNDLSGIVDTYTVVDCVQHPSFAGGLEFSFAICRIVGVPSHIEVIPPADTPDGVGSGTAIVHVGYGVTSLTDTTNTARRFASGTIDQVYSVQFGYDTTSGGPCMGDTGGPQLAGMPERVVGVTAGGSDDCTYGISGRVSAVADTFIWPYVNGGGGAGGSAGEGGGAGTAGSAGEGGGAGTAGSAGTGGSAGAAGGSGGSAGTAGASGTAGAAGSGGTGGNAGATGGASGTGGNADAGATGGTSGATGGGAGSPQAPSPGSGTDSGGCQIGSFTASTPFAWLAVFVLGLAIRRGSRRKSPR